MNIPNSQKSMDVFYDLFKKRRCIQDITSRNFYKRRRYIEKNKYKIINRFKKDPSHNRGSDFVLN